MKKNSSKNKFENNGSVVLIFPKTKEVEFEDIEVPFSIFFLGSYLTQADNCAGRKVALFDERVTNIKKILNFISKNHSRYIGISTMSGPQLSFAIKISREIRHLSPFSIIIWGGIHPTICPDSVICQDYVDYVVRGEGEETLKELIDTIEQKGKIENVTGITFKKNGQIFHNPDRPFMDINRITLDWALLETDKYIKKIDGRYSLAFISSRGCIYRCKYCWNTVVNKRKFRSWTIEKTKFEIEKIANLGINYINFLDDELSIDKNRLFRLCEYCRKKDIFWSGSMRINFIVEKENIDKLYNCRSLFLGAESGSQRILDYLKKDLTVDDTIQSTHRLKEFGISGNYSWMIGFPAETKEDFYKTLHLVDTIVEILPEAAQRIRIYNPYPGTELYKSALEKGFKSPDTLEGWSYFSREYCVLQYIKNPWLLKCISYVSFFHFYTGKRRQNKFIYSIPIKFIQWLAKWRWRYKYFNFPLEYMLIESVRRLMNPAYKRQ